MNNLIIFDADSIIWTVAYKFRNKKLKNLLLISLNSYITEIIQTAKATHYIGFYGSKAEGRIPNFRYAIESKYKANRPPEPDWIKKWRSVIIKEFEDKWKFIPVEGMEADDAVSICANHYFKTKDYDKIIVATIDKDLKQIPNVTFYNYRDHQMTDQDDFQAAKALGEQVLKGDAVDNIKGLYNIGAKKASNIISPCKSITEIKWTVCRMYAEHEMELRRKATIKIVKETRDSIKEDPWALDKTEKQISRKVRLESSELIDQELELKNPGGWKEYLKQQYNLIFLLTEAPSSFIIPEPTISTITLVEEAADDFLFV